MTERKGITMKQLRITVNGKAYDVQVEEIGASTVAAAPAAVPAPAAAPAPAPVAAAPQVAPAPAAAPTPAAPVEGAEQITSPMPGTIVDIKVAAGDTVKSGDVLVVLEAMKMENEIMAPRDCVVAGVHVGKGDSVNSGTLLVSIQ